MKTHLGVTVNVQLQTRIAKKSCPISWHREDLVCYIALTNTHDSEGVEIRSPLTVYCCGKMTAVRLWKLCGMYYGADMEPDSEPDGKRPKMRFLKKFRSFEYNDKRGCGDEKDRLLV